VFHNTTLRRKAAVDFCMTTSCSAPLVLKCRLGLAPSLCTRTPCSWLCAPSPQPKALRRHSTSPLTQLLRVLEIAHKDSPRRYKFLALRRKLGYGP
jgi:hypothetical protein